MLASIFDLPVHTDSCSRATVLGPTEAAEAPGLMDKEVLDEHVSSVRCVQMREEAGVGTRTQREGVGVDT